MILTLTANPSVDRTVTLPGRIERGEVLRATGVTFQAGGKGVNISRAATQAGVATLAVLPAGEHDPFVSGLLGDGIACVPTPPAGPVRTNLTLVEPDGTTTKVNTPGAEVTGEVLDHLATALEARTPTASWVVLAGSLPPGAPPDWYASLVTRLREHDVPVAVDTSDAPLLALGRRLAEGDRKAAPDLLKPNGAELAELVRGLGGEVSGDLEADPAAAAAAARRLVEAGVGAVLATLGPAGAVLVTSAGAWHATPPPTEVLSTVGAGDSSLFGYLYAGLAAHAPADPTPAERLRSAVAWGSAAAGLPGTTIPRPSQTRPDLVAVRDVTDHLTEDPHDRPDHP